MAKVLIVGEAVVITSSLKLEDLRRVEKYRPNALVLMGGEDEMEPVFRISTTDGKGSIGRFGAAFGSETRDDEKLAAITLLLKDEYKSENDIREFIAEEFGGALSCIKKIEKNIPAVLNDINSERSEILDSIKVL